MERKAPNQVPFAGWVPVITLILLLMPVLCLDAISLSIWPVILLVDLLIIGLAVMTGRLMPVLAALVLTLITAGAWLFRWPREIGFTLMPFLFVIGGFAVLFGIASSFLSRKLPKVAFSALLPVSSAVLPFLLLILATLRLQIANPSPVFGLALLLTVFLLGLVRISGITALAPTALGCVLALEWAWHQQSFSVEQATTPLLWYLGFYAIFTAFPLVFQKQFATRKLPWIASAAAGIGTFSLVYRLVGQTWPNEMMGLLPVAFAIAPLLCLVFVLKQHGADNPARLTQLAWFGGVALFFITLIFPIQFEKQWITIGWALEGAASVLALPPCAASRPAWRRHGAARCLLHPSCRESRRAGVSNPWRDADPQLAALRLQPLRAGDVLRRLLAHTADASLGQNQPARPVRLARRHPALPAAQHRNRRRLHAGGPALDHLRLQTAIWPAT
jgi:hypothetical protein